MTIPPAIVLDPKVLARAKRQAKWRKIRANRRICADFRAANPKRERFPSDYGLSPEELRAHGSQLVASHGWSASEIQVTLTNPAEVAA